MADSKTGDIVNGSQQQFLVRDSSIGSWSNAVWNQVFAGVQGAPAQSFPNPPYTTLDTNPVSREKPYLTVDSANRYSVFVPDARARLGRHDLGERQHPRQVDSAVQLLPGQARRFRAHDQQPSWPEART